MRSFKRLGYLGFLFWLGVALPCLADSEPPLQLASGDLSPAARYQHYRGMIERYGAGRDPDETWVIALRGLSAWGERSEPNVSAGGYLDTVVVVRGERAIEFKAATHGGGARSSRNPWGLPLIRPGLYEAEPSATEKGAPVWRLLTSDGEDALPVWLDRDFDGRVSQDERDLDDYYGTTARDGYFQDGLDEDTPQSVGGAALLPGAFPKFVTAVGRGRTFHFLLLDANSPRREEATDLRLLSTPLSPQDDFRFYERLALRNGADPDFQVMVVALRGVAPNGTRHRSEENDGPYNDTFLVLRRDAGGRLSVRAFLGSTHAGQKSSLRVPAVYAGVAQVRPGLYYARSYNVYHDLWAWHVVRHEADRDGELPAWRDRDKDGFLSEEEKRKAERAGTTADEILIHNGIDTYTGASIGCLTMPPPVMVDFISYLGTGNSFPLLLLDANLADGGARH